MYCCSPVQFEIVQGNEIVFSLCQKQPTALKYLLIFHQNRQKQNGVVEETIRILKNNPEMKMISSHRQQYY